MEIGDIKAALNKPVRYIERLHGDEAEYILTAYVLRRKGNKYIHQAELTERANGKAISCIIARLEDIEKI